MDYLHMYQLMIKAKVDYSNACTLNIYEKFSIVTWAFLYSWQSNDII